MAKYGLPDYGMYAALENMGNLVDYGELAARLGSIVTFNREGNIVFWDDFEGTPLKWAVEKEVGTETVGFSTFQVSSGGQALKIATVADATSSAGIRRFFPLFSTKKQGMEVSIRGSTTPSHLKLIYYTILNEKAHIYVVKIDSDNEILQYYDEDADWITLDDNFGLKQAAYLFHHFKLVIDVERGYYVRLIIDRTEYSLNDIPAKIMNMYEPDYFYVKIVSENVTANMVNIYLDNFILTQNEP